MKQIIVLLFLFIVGCDNIQNNNPNVKKSSSNICHEKGSQYYKQTKKYESFSSIEDCLNSLMECNYRDIEFLIINDASSDDTAQKVKRYCEIDNRFHLINFDF